MNIFLNTPPAALILEDGSEYHGFAIGAIGTSVGEIVFNTSMFGYQEIMTDPSYAEQIILFSYPHIGNVGCNTKDNESSKVWANGIIVQDCCDYPSNYRMQTSLHDFLCQQNVVGIAGIDTRALVEKIRDNGAQKACIVSGTLTSREHEPSLGLASSCPYIANTKPGHHIVVYDYGVKQSILDALIKRNCRITVVPATTSAKAVLALNPDGIILSNGPGDPRTYGDAIHAIQHLLTLDIPLFGICLGHQLLALASGAKVYKMKFGHHGANHPIMNVSSKKVYITSQNHGFAVEPTSLPSHIEPTFISLFDQTLQGLSYKNKPFFSIQCHPEAGPGPHDLNFLFDAFINKIQLRKKSWQKEMILIPF